jgi:hypothetical protein
MIKASVEYYNNEEADLFKSYNNYIEINDKIQSGITIPKSEVLTYLMFTEQAEEDGWRTYKDLQERVQKRYADIEDILNFDDDSIKSKQSSTRMNASGLTERLGVSLGLNVVNQLHNLSEADWSITKDKYIGGKRIKDFDYEIELASDGQRFIQVENKGNVCADNSKKNSSVSKHYSSIKGKKNEILRTEKSNNIPLSENIYYGTIGVIDDQNIAKVWLVDPDPFQLEIGPRLFRLTTRLKFYLNLFKAVEIRKVIVDALEERIEKIEQSRRYQEFNKIRLVSGNLMTYIERHTLLTKINSNEAFGIFFPIETNSRVGVYILAVTKEIIKHIINQDFEAILNYSCKNGEFEDKVIVELSIGKKAPDLANESLAQYFVKNDKRNSLNFQDYYKLNYTSSGRIFGFMSIGD